MDDTTAIQLPENALTKPYQDTQFAQASAKQLMAIVRQNGWAKKLGGQSEHLQFEAWQTAGKYYHLTVDTDKQDVEYVEYDGVWGFKAHAEVIDNNTGQRVGGASALCMSDEENWKNKPKFQLMSMAQTRAGSKALRQILSFVVALAGFNPTPYEEMIPEKTASYSQDDAKTAIKEVKARKAQVVEEGEVVETSLADDVCTDCIMEGIALEEAKVTDKVKDFSFKKFGTVLCFEHQKQH